MLTCKDKDLETIKIMRLHGMSRDVRKKIYARQHSKKFAISAL